MTAIHRAKDLPQLRIEGQWQSGLLESAPTASRPWLCGTTRRPSPCDGADLIFANGLEDPSRSSIRRMARCNSPQGGWESIAIAPSRAAPSKSRSAADGAHAVSA